MLHRMEQIAWCTRFVVAALLLYCATANRSTNVFTLESIIGRPTTELSKTSATWQPMQQVEAVSWEPRIILHHDFLTHEECDYLRTNAEPRLQASVVANPDSAMPLLDQARTSTGMFFNRKEDSIIRQIEDRIALWTMLPADNGEGIQVLQYKPGQKYDAHHDYFYYPSEILHGGNRVATVLMYLTDVQQGGETVFPDMPKLPHQTLENGWTDCGMQGLGIRPKKGDAILFWSLRPDGVFDPLTRHASCPVVSGEKVVATRWVHEKHYEVTPDAEGPKQRQPRLGTIAITGTSVATTAV